MKHARFWSLIIGLGLIGALTLSACAGDPAPDIQKAETAVQGALDAGADDIAPDALQKAKDLLEKAKSLAQEGKNRDAIKYADQAALIANKAEQDSRRMEAARADRDNS